MNHRGPAIGAKSLCLIEGPKDLPHVVDTKKVPKDTADLMPVAHPKLHTPSKWPSRWLFPRKKQGGGSCFLPNRGETDFFQVRTSWKQNTALIVLPDGC